MTFQALFYTGDNKTDKVLVLLFSKGCVCAHAHIVGKWNINKYTSK